MHSWHLFDDTEDTWQKKVFWVGLAVIGVGLVVPITFFIMFLQRIF